MPLYCQQEIRSALPPFVIEICFLLLKASFIIEKKLLLLLFATPVLVQQIFSYIPSFSDETREKSLTFSIFTKMYQILNYGISIKPPVA